MANELEHTVKCKSISSNSPEVCKDKWTHADSSSIFYMNIDGIVFPLNLTCLIIMLQKVITVMCRWDCWFKKTQFSVLN